MKRTTGLHYITKVAKLQISMKYKIYNIIYIYNMYSINTGFHIFSVATLQLCNYPHYDCISLATNLQLSATFTHKHPKT